MKEAMKYVRLVALAVSAIVTIIMECCGASAPLALPQSAVCVHP